MMKKLWAILTIFILLLMTACQGLGAGGASDSSLNTGTGHIESIGGNSSHEASEIQGVITEITEDPTDNEEETNTSASNSSSKSNGTSSSKNSTNKSSQVASSKPAATVTPSKVTAVSSIGATQSNVAVNQAPTSSDVTTEHHEIDISAPCPSVSSSKHYQYTTLTAAEKEAYARIHEAVEKTENMVKIDDLGIPSSRAGAIYVKYMADYPQHFWLARSYIILTLSGQTNAYAFLLCYTDGKTVDSFDNQQHLVTEADRNLITTQIATFKAKVQAMANKVPKGLDEAHKVRVIHDMVVKHLTYDTSAVSQSSDTCRSYDAYGAVMNGKAVCEGYAKLFQYLCYCLGIECNEVIGTAGGAHMWNVVRINNKWYQMDVSWDDAIGNDLPYYGYYNLTNTQMYTDHKASNTLAVPTCTATTASFDHIYGIVANAPDAPTNVEHAADELAKDDDEYLILFTNGNVDVDYLQKHFYDKNGVWRTYLASKGYTFMLDTTYYSVQNFIYIPIIR